MLKASPRVPKNNRGFTLLEILLVLLLMGLAGSVVVGRVMPENSRGEAIKQAERFAALTGLLRDQALQQGKEYGVQFDKTGYRFLRLAHSQWQTVDNDRRLKPQSLDTDFGVVFTPGESVWLESLEHEDLQEEDDDNEQPTNLPDIYLWSSGEISPGELVFRSVKPELKVVLQESGDIYVIENNSDGKAS
ncbi:type II secretion system minor pseudopilin GspH [Parendozoicomonas haliclonae]|uniref:Type II secretion system protein H n=1 Tax=Parendozoicomonas haliclonae TaxID=1960125 RepID=A0A1X7AGU5_9GAMM|nr:type II secretion system minor pseudopilin GspH [Parendozoicomonas haliclonae]SMA39492.1 Type II secretion system protein H precursor [Parendozoicomonas haliclonae]